MKRYFVLFTFLLFIVVGLVSGLTLVSCSKDAGGDAPEQSGTTVDAGDPGSSTIANPFVGNTYKEMRPGRDEDDYWYFETDTVVHWGKSLDYKYTFTDTTIELTARGYYIDTVEYSFNEDKTVLYLHSSKGISGQYTKQ